MATLLYSRRQPDQAADEASLTSGVDVASLAGPGGGHAGLQHEATGRRDLADFARLVEAHNGVWGGCWCMGFHPKGEGWGKSAELNRAEKEARVREGQAHAALVYDGARCVGWCQFGVPDELPRIKNRRAYLEGLDDLPDWRITCFFVGRGHRARVSPQPRSPGRSRRSRGPAEGWSRAIRTRSMASSVGIVPAQRHPGDVRAAGFRTDPPDRQDPLGGAQAPRGDLLSTLGLDALRDLRMQNSLPSGSASTTHDCSPWPMSTRDRPAD